MPKMKYFFCTNTLTSESTTILAYDKHHAKNRALVFFNTDLKNIKVKPVK